MKQVPNDKCTLNEHSVQTKCERQFIYLGEWRQIASKRHEAKKEEEKKLTITIDLNARSLGFSLVLRSVANERDENESLVRIESKKLC